MVQFGGNLVSNTFGSQGEQSAGFLDDFHAVADEFVLACDSREGILQLLDTANQFSLNGVLYSGNTMAKEEYKATWGTGSGVGFDVPSNGSPLLGLPDPKVTSDPL